MYEYRTGEKPMTIDLAEYEVTVEEEEEMEDVGEVSIWH
jgi:hypothetical protein